MADGGQEDAGCCPFFPLLFVLLEETIKRERAWTSLCKDTLNLGEFFGEGVGIRKPNCLIAKLG